MGGEPFLFDKHVFDDDPLIGMDDDDRPLYTQGDLDNATQKSYDKGKQDGIQEIQNSIKTEMLTVLQKIERDMTVLFAAENDRNAKHESEATHLTYETLKKLFPLFVEQYGKDELFAAIKQAMQDHSTPENIKIELHDAMLGALKAELEELGQSFGKDIQLFPNPSLQNHECRILWPDGGMIINRDKIAEKTFSLIQEALAEGGIKVHDEVDIKDDLPTNPPESRITDQTEDNSPVDDKAGEDE